MDGWIEDFDAVQVRCPNPCINARQVLSLFPDTLAAPHLCTAPIAPDKLLNFLPGGGRQAGIHLGMRRHQELEAHVFGLGGNEQVLPQNPPPPPTCHWPARPCR